MIVCMNKRSLVVLAVGMCCQVGLADVYVERSETGTVRYTDQPRTADATSYALTPPLEVLLPEIDSPHVDSLDVPLIKIISPRPDEAIRSNHGEIKVRAQFESLPTEFSCGFFVNGELAGISKDGAMFLQNIDRGTHALKVRVIDPAGDIVATSEEVRFHMLRHSILH